MVANPFGRKAMKQGDASRAAAEAETLLRNLGNADEKCSKFKAQVKGP